MADAPAARVEVWNAANTSKVADLTVAGSEPDDPEWITPISARLHTQLNADGDGEVTVALNHPNASALSARRVLRFTEKVGDTTHHLGAVTIDEVRSVLLTEQTGGRVRSARGAGLLSRFRDQLILPWNGADGALPQTNTRLHNWASPGIDPAWFGDTLYTQTRDDLLWGGTLPVAWPDPYSAWIWGAEDATEHAAGVNIFDRSFTLADDALVAFYLSMDDAADVAVDGVLLLEEDFDLDDLSNWWWTWRAVVRLSAGTHVFRAKVTNAAATGPGAFRASAWTVDEAGGIIDLIFVSGTPNGEPVGDWRCAAYPDPMPGFTAGRMVRQWVEEAQARGCCPSVSLGFTDTTDSAGNPFTNIADFAIDITTIGAGLDALAEAWCDVDVDTSGSGIELLLFDKGEGGQGEEKSVDLIEGANLRFLSHVEAA